MIVRLMSLDFRELGKPLGQHVTIVSFKNIIHLEIIFYDYHFLKNQVLYHLKEQYFQDRS